MSHCRGKVVRVLVVRHVSGNTVDIHEIPDGSEDINKFSKPLGICVETLLLDQHAEQHSGLRCGKDQEIGGWVVFEE